MNDLENSVLNRLFTELGDFEAFKEAIRKYLKESSS
jgi:hypothetical protein